MQSGFSFPERSRINPGTPMNEADQLVTAAMTFAS
jgi:hypothetical protein